MASSRPWNESSPAGTDFASSIDDFMREMKVDIRERMVSDHVWGASQADDGKHTNLRFRPQINTPVMSTELVALTNGGSTAGLADLSIALNTTGNVAVFAINIADTAHGASSLAFVINKNGAPLFAVDMNGNIGTLGSITASNISLSSPTSSLTLATLTVTGATNLNTLTVTGICDLQAVSVSDLHNTGSMSVDGTIAALNLTIGGTTTLNGVTVSGNLVVNGAQTQVKGFRATAAAAFDGSVTIAGPTAIGNTLSVTGTLTVGGLATFNGGISMPAGVANFAGGVTMTAGLNVASGGLSVSGAASVTGPLTVNGIVTAVQLCMPSQTYTVAGAVNDNIPLSGVSLLVINGGGGVSDIGGFAHSGQDGRILLVVNARAVPMTIIQESAGSAAGNRILTTPPTRALVAGGMMLFAWSGAVNRWIQLNYT